MTEDDKSDKLPGLCDEPLVIQDEEFPTSLLLTQTISDTQ